MSTAPTVPPPGWDPPPFPPAWLTRRLRRVARVDLPARFGPRWEPKISIGSPPWPGGRDLADSLAYGRWLGLPEPAGTLERTLTACTGPLERSVSLRLTAYHQQRGARLWALHAASRGGWRSGAAEAASMLAAQRFLADDAGVETLYAHLLAALRGRAGDRACWVGRRPVPTYPDDGWKLVVVPADQPAAWQAAARGRALAHTFDRTHGLPGGLLWLLIRDDELAAARALNGAAVVGPGCRPSPALWATFLELAGGLAWPDAARAAAALAMR